MAFAAEWQAQLKKLAALPQFPIVVAAAAVIVFILLIVCVCVYLKFCQTHGYTPLNGHVVSATLPLAFLAGGAAAFQAAQTSRDYHTLLLGIAILCVLYALAIFCVNLFASFRLFRSPVFSFFNLLVQQYIGLMIAATLGLALLLISWGLNAMFHQRDD